MAQHSAIEWTEATWNPTIGCTKVSPGCDRCYAERITRRFPQTYPKGFELTLREAAIDLPLEWRIDYLRRVPAAVRFISAEPLLAPLPNLNLSGIQWLIAGGESQTGARPAQLEWFRDLRDQCAAARVAFFLKQLGGHPSKRGGDQAVLDGRRWTLTPAAGGTC